MLIMKCLVWCDIFLFSSSPYYENIYSNYCEYFVTIVATNAFTFSS